MREIKFRVWDKKHKEMCEVLKIDYAQPPFILCGKEWVRILGFKDAILMQYTGLKDCNGVEIYEGDIIQNTYFAYDGKSYDLASVIFENGEFKMNKCGGYSLAEFISKADYLKSEVVGNIYENKELLK